MSGNPLLGSGGFLETIDELGSTQERAIVTNGEDLSEACPLTLWGAFGGDQDVSGALPASQVLGLGGQSGSQFPAGGFLGSDSSDEEGETHTGWFQRGGFQQSSLYQGSGSRDQSPPPDLEFFSRSPGQNPLPVGTPPLDIPNRPRARPSIDNSDLYRQTSAVSPTSLPMVARSQSPSSQQAPFSPHLRAPYSPDFTVARDERLRSPIRDRLARQLSLDLSDVVNSAKYCAQKKEGGASSLYQSPVRRVVINLTDMQRVADDLFQQ